jgi:hypothetical protein
MHNTTQNNDVNIEKINIVNIYCEKVGGSRERNREDNYQEYMEFQLEKLVDFQW